MGDISGEIALSVSNLPSVEKFYGSGGLQPEFADLRNFILEKLVDERPDASAMSLMLMERTSYVYARLRQREATGAFGNEGNYKASMQVLAQYMGELQKADDQQKLADVIRTNALDSLVKSLREAVQDLPKEDQRAIINRVIELSAAAADERPKK